MSRDDTVDRDRQLWTHIFANEFGIDSILPPVRDFVNEHFARPLSSQIQHITAVKENIKERVREFKRVPATPKRNRLARDDYRQTLEEFVGSLQQLSLEDSEVDELMKYEGHGKSPSRTPDLDIIDKKKPASVCPASATPKMPKSAVRASRVRVASATRTPITRSVTARIRDLSTPVARSEMGSQSPSRNRDRTTNEKRQLKKECDFKLECASINRDERLREEVERKKREREDRERRVELNRREQQRIEDEKQAAIRQREKLVEQLRLDQLDATKRGASRSPSRRPPLPVPVPSRTLQLHSSVSTTASTASSAQSGIPRFVRGTEASNARNVRPVKEKGDVARTKKLPESSAKPTAEERKKATAERRAATKLAKEEAAARKKDEEEQERKAKEEARKKEERKRAVALEAERRRALEERRRQEEEERTAEAFAQEEEFRKAIALEDERLRLEAVQTEQTMKTPTQPLRSKNDMPDNAEYEITPDKVYKKSSVSNYNIEDLSSGDETDDDQNPRKKVPSWAEKGEIKKAAERQAELDPRYADRIFPPLVIPDLASIFLRQTSRYTKRTSSAVWNSPLEQPTIGKSRFPNKKRKH